MKKSKKYFFFSKLRIFLFIFFACNLTVQAQDYEHILNFHSDIKIDTTGRIDVTETITIKVTGESIKRGIIRTIPIYRENAQNLKKRIDIEVDSVFKNGTIEHFSTKKENQDLAIYIGEENKTIAPNIYEYKIKYSSRGHVGFFDNYDEIYWNVNGNDWEFDIDSVSATVHLPRGAKFIDNSCYTGVLDSKASDCSSYTVGDSIIKYQTNSKLNRKEGLTIATSFTPNIINRPPPPTAFESFMESKGVIILFIIFVICIIYYYIVSLRKVNTMNGRKIMIPTFDPPLNKSAGELNYLYKREASKTTLVSSILSMAVKKAIVIKKEKSSYILTALGETNDLSAEESSLYKNMFTSAGDAVTLGKKNTLPSKALEGLESTLKTQDKIKDYFLPKESYIYKFWIGAICVLFVWLLILQATTSFLAKDMFILTIAKICVISLVPAWYIAKKTHFAVFIVMLTIMSSFSKDIGELTSTAVQSYSSSLAAILLILEILFSKYIYPLTSKGVQFSGELEGFKKYLTVAEENRLNMLTPPDLTPEQFEKMLPYAVALGLEVKWAKKFEKSFPITSDYQPNWYVGSSNGSYIKFTKGLSKSLSSSVNRSISTLTSAGASYGGSSSGSRGWSSGSGGRGSSGRGGGGGGGRGW